MRIATLNIQSGGGEKERREPLWAVVRSFEPALDCIVLTEFTSQNGPWLRKQAEAAGFTCVSHTTIPDIRGSSGVLIAAKSQFKARENPADFNAHGERVMRATFDQFTLYGIYLPQQTKKEPHLKYLIEEARQRPHDKMICIGDFNTGRCDLDVENSAENPRPIFESPSFRELERYWTDAWRKIHPADREFSWYWPEPRRGFRIDHCFVSGPLVSRIRSADYDPRPREMTYKPSKTKPSKRNLPKTLTDHSALIVEIDI